MCSLGEQGIYAQHHIQYHLITLHSKRVPVSHLLSLLSFKNGFIQSYRMYMSFKVKGFARIWDYVYFECHYTVYVNWWNLIESCGCDVKRLFFRIGSQTRQMKITWIGMSVRSVVCCWPAQEILSDKFNPVTFVPTPPQISAPSVI